MIVKVTMPASGQGSAQIEFLEGKTSVYMPVTEKLRKRMRTNTVQHFIASMRDDGTVRLGDYAPWPNTYEHADEDRSLLA